MKDFLYLCAEIKNIIIKMKTESVTLRMEKKLRDKLQALADKDNRKLSDYIHLQLLKLIELKKTK